MIIWVVRRVLHHGISAQTQETATNRKIQDNVQSSTASHHMLELAQNKKDWIITLMRLITPHDVSDRRKPNDVSTLTNNIQFKWDFKLSEKKKTLKKLHTISFNRSIPLNYDMNMNELIMQLTRFDISRKNYCYNGI